MDSNTSEYFIIFATTYLLSALFLMAYKAGLNDFYFRTRYELFREIRAVHPLAVLAGFVSLVPLSLVRLAEDTSLTTISIAIGATVYFVATLFYRQANRLKVIDFSIDNGSNFNDEISADPTIAQKMWLFLVSWAGALSLGVFFGAVVSYNNWKDQTNWLTDQPSDTEARVYVYVFLGLILVSMIIFKVFRTRRHRKLPTAAKVRRAVNRSWFIPAWFGLMFAALMDFTRNTTLTNRYWVIIFFIWIGFVSLWNLVFVAPNARRHLMEDRKFFEEHYKRVRRQRNKKRKRRR